MPAAPSIRELQAKLDDTAVRGSAPSTLATPAPGMITNHRWISFGGEVLALSINLAETTYPTPTEINKFHRIVELYAPYTKICLISATLPEYAFDVPRSNHGKIFFDLVSIINQFPRTSGLEVIFRMPRESIAQLFNASHFYRLEFQDWKLFLKVGSWDLEQIHVGSILERRLRGWYRVNIAGGP